MTPDLLLRLAIRPALTLLPSSMNSREAVGMLLAIAWQESEMRHRKQVRGPAVSYWQFEAGGGIGGVLRHRSTAPHAQWLCESLDVKASIPDVYDAMQYHDVLAAGFARLLLWTLPGPLPQRGHRDTGWAQYLDGWRPGKPHETRWPQSWAVAWGALAVDTQA